MEALAAFLCFLMGVMAGIAGTVAVHRLGAAGDLRIDTSDPDSPYLFLELKPVYPVGRLCREDFVTLRVKAEDLLPQD